jgi:hypothetical protein
MAGNDSRGGLALSISVVFLVFVFFLGPLILHFTQKQHSRLPLDLAAEFPSERALAGGEAYAATLVALIEHELHGGRTGWRPNDFVLWGPGLWADNNANRQLGILLAVRESLRVFKDHLTKVSSDEFDANLIAADNAFRNDPKKFWLPAAETKLKEGVRHLRAYLKGLHATPPTSRPIKQRNVELIRLFQTWTDLLGDAHATLYRKDVGFLQTDDVYYRSQGMAHGIHALALAVQREYSEALKERPTLQTLLEQIVDALSKAAVLKPIAVLGGSPSGLFANHRRNLDSYITEARQKMYSVREELEK